MVKLLIFSILLIIGNEALAAAWLQKPGKSELITLFESQTLTTYFKDPQDTSTNNSRNFYFENYNVLYQYGLNEDFTVGMNSKWYNYKGFTEVGYGDDYSNDSLLLKNAPSEEYVFFSEEELSLDGTYKQNENKPLESSFFFRKSLWQYEETILSVQPALQFYNQEFDKALELRFLYGQSFKFLKNYSYVNVEAAAGRRTRAFLAEDINNTTFNIDLTLGIGVSKRNTIMLQSFYKFNRALYGNEYSNIGQVSLVFKYNEYFAWQSGYSTNLNDRKNYISESITTGVWLNF